LRGEELITALRSASYSVHVLTGHGGGYAGSAIAVSPRHLLTAWHVVAPGQGRLPTIRSELRLPAPTVISVQQGAKDVAILTVDQPLPYYLPPAPSRWHKAAAPGDMILVWASHSVIAQLRPFSVKAGYLTGSALRDDTDFAFSLPVVQGVSGSGIVHVPSGKVIGIVTHSNLGARDFPRGKDPSISYGADGYEVVRAVGLLDDKEKARRDDSAIPKLRWWSREIKAAGVGFLVAVVILLVVRR